MIGLKNTTEKIAHHKSIPALRFKEFDGKWNVSEMCDYLSLISGFAFQSELFSEHGTKLITPKNFTKIGKAYFDEKNTKFTIEDVDSKFICKSGDLLVLLTDLTPSCELLGKPVLLTEADGDVLLNQRIVKIVEKENVISKPFLSNLFQTDNYHKRIKETSTGTTVRHSSNKVLLSYQAAIPTLPEQQKIVSFLSAIEEKTQQLTRKKELLEQYKKGVMQKLFSGNLRFKDENGKACPKWEEKMLGELGDFKGGGTPNTSVEKYWRGSIPWISSSDVFENDIRNIRINRHISVEAVNESATKLIPKESIMIVSRVGVGKLAISKEELCTSQDFTNFVPKDCSSYYVGYLLIARKNILANLSQGTSIKGFTTDDLKSLKIPIPIFAEQQKIANCLLAIDTKIESVSAQITQTQTFKKGLLQQMFV